MEGVPIAEGREEPAPISNSRGNSKKNETFVLDTKGTCFLCLNEVPSGNGRNEIGTESGGVSLQVIFRYLNINPFSFTSGVSNEGPHNQGEGAGGGDKAEPGIPDLKVTLCGICTSHVKHLSSLIQQMERIQRLLTRELQVFHEIVSETEQDPGSFQLWRNLHEKMNANGLEGGLLLEKLRKEAVDKSSATLFRLMRQTLPSPSARPSRNGTEKQIFSSDVTIAPEQMLVEEIPLLSGTTGAGENGTKNVSMESGSSEANVTSSSTPADPKLQPGSSKVIIQTCDIINPEKWTTDVISTLCRPQSGNRVRCPFCWIVTLESPMRIHLGYSHSHKIYASKKPSKMSYDKFKLSCVRALKSASDEFGIAPVNSPRCHYLCSVCKTECSSRNEFQGHFVLKHPNMFETKLSSILTSPVKTPTAPKKSKELEKNNSVPSEDKKNCSKRMDTQVSLRELRNNRSKTFLPQLFVKKRPLKSQHLLKNLSISENPILSGTFKKHCVELTCTGNFLCGLCNEREVKVPSKCELSKHLWNTHPEQFFLQLKLPEVSDQDFKSWCHHVLNEWSQFALEKVEESNKTIYYECPACDQLLFRDHYNLKYHFLLEHYEELGQRVTSLQQEVLNGTVQVMDHHEEGGPLHPNGSIDPENGSSDDSMDVEEKWDEVLDGGDMGIECQSVDVNMSSDEAIPEVEKEESKLVIKSCYSLVAPPVSILPDI